MGLGSKRRTVLVTGAAGFLGSHLVDSLLADDFEVVGLDNLMTGDLENLRHATTHRNFHLEIGDVREGLLVYAEVVFNLACPASPKHYQADPETTFETCVRGAMHLAEYARARRARVVQASTSEVYGDPEIHPQHEGYWGHVNPVGPRACYDEGKRAAETVLLMAHDAGADVRVARIFNTYGPRMALDDGRVVSNFLRQALRSEPITIYGDGSQTRSFCYVSDTVAGLRALSRHEPHDCPELETPIFNIGNPVESTMIDLASAVLHTVGTGRLVREPLPQDDPRRRCPDISKARRLLGFEPEVRLEEGIRKTYLDFSARMGLEPKAEDEPVTDNYGSAGEGGW